MEINYLSISKRNNNSKSNHTNEFSENKTNKTNNSINNIYSDNSSNSSNQDNSFASKISLIKIRMPNYNAFKPPMPKNNKIFNNINSNIMLTNNKNIQKKTLNVSSPNSESNNRKNKDTKTYSENTFLNNIDKNKNIINPSNSNKVSNSSITKSDNSKSYLNNKVDFSDISYIKNNDRDQYIKSPKINYRPTKEHKLTPFSKGKPTENNDNLFDNINQCKKNIMTTLIGSDVINEKNKSSKNSLVNNICSNFNLDSSNTIEDVNNNNNNQSSNYLNCVNMLIDQLLNKKDSINKNCYIPENIEKNSSNKNIKENDNYLSNSKNSINNKSSKLTNDNTNNYDSKLKSCFSKKSKSRENQLSIKNEDARSSNNYKTSTNNTICNESKSKDKDAFVNNIKKISKIKEYIETSKPVNFTNLNFDEYQKLFDNNEEEVNEYDVLNDLTEKNTYINSMPEEDEDKYQIELDYSS